MQAVCPTASGFKGVDSESPATRRNLGLEFQPRRGNLRRGTLGTIVAGVLAPVLAIPRFFPRQIASAELTCCSRCGAESPTGSRDTNLQSQSFSIESSRARWTVIPAVGLQYPTRQESSAEGLAELPLMLQLPMVDPWFP